MDSLDYTSGQKVAQEIDRRIQNIAREAYAGTPKNTTKFGRVTAVNGAFCTLMIDRKEYPNVPLYRSVGELNVGDVVDCLIPNGNFSNIRVIGIANGTLGGGGDGSTVIIRRWEA